MKNKTKNIKFKIKSEDVRSLSATALNLIVKRFGKTSLEAAKNISLQLENGSKKEILEALKTYIEAHELCIEEMSRMPELLLDISPKSVPNTQVVKDLPDLKEDGLGVDSGSE